MSFNDLSNDYWNIIIPYFIDINITPCVGNGSDFIYYIKIHYVDRSDIRKYIHN